MEKIKAMVTTKTTVKLSWLAILVPFIVICFYAWTGKGGAGIADIHQHLGDYTKWGLGMLIFGKAGHEVGHAFANRKPGA